MKLAEVEALVAVLEHGSLSAAGRALGRPRNRVQSQIDQLEEELGRRLLIRGPHGATATRAGELFAARAGALLAEAEAVRHCLNDAPTEERLRVAMEPGLPPHLVAFGTQLLRSQLSMARVEIVVTTVEDALSDPAVDLIWQTGDTLPAGEHRTFVVQRVPVRLLASPGYLAERGRPSSVEDLEEHDLLAWTGYRPERQNCWPRGDGSTFAVTPVVTSNDAHLLRNLANAGQGIALVPDAPQLQGTLVGEELVPVLDPDVGEDAVGRVLIPERAAEAPAVRGLIALARELGFPGLEIPSA